MMIPAGPEFRYIPKMTVNKDVEKYTHFLSSLRLFVIRII